MKLYCADCMDILKGIPEGSIDMILCDLPYGTTRNKWDVIIPLERCQHSRSLFVATLLPAFEGVFPHSKALVVNEPAATESTVN